VIWPNCVFSSRLIACLHDRGGGDFFWGPALSSQSEQFKNIEKALVDRLYEVS